MAKDRPEQSACEIFSIKPEFQQFKLKPHTFRVLRTKTLNLGILSICAISANTLI